jgi:hypothetical protein
MSPGPEDRGRDGAEAEPAECGEGQQVDQGVGRRADGPPEREQEHHDGRGRDEQVRYEPELVAELFTWLVRADPPARC